MFRAVKNKGTPWIAAGLALFSNAGCERKPSVSPTSAPVLVVQAGTRDVPVYREWIGTLSGFENADIRARVSGHLIKRDYEEGSLVKQGDVLFEIDPRPFEVALAEAQSELEEGRAVQLASQAEADRSRELFKKKVISEKEFINKTQLNQSKLSKVRALEAAVGQAQLNLQFCQVLSPVDGIAAVAKAQVGDLVGTSSNTVLTSVSTLDPVKVIFPISEEEYLLASARVAEIIRRPLQERPESVELILATGKPFPHKGRLLSVDLNVSTSTGTILVTALLKNPGSLLRPGQFARARVMTSVLEKAVVVPQRAVAEIQGSCQVAVIGADGRGEIRPVTTGTREGTDWVITHGLKAGETVVVEGFQNVRPGVPVSTSPWKPPALPAAPGAVETPAQPAPGAP
jgi:membrane fusion protein (multidrug efflux system)